MLKTLSYYLMSLVLKKTNLIEMVLLISSNHVQIIDEYHVHCLFCPHELKVVIHFFPNVVLLYSLQLLPWRRQIWILSTHPTFYISSLRNISLGLWNAQYRWSRQKFIKILQLAWILPVLVKNTLVIELDWPKYYEPYWFVVLV